MVPTNVWQEARGSQARSIRMSSCSKSRPVETPVDENGDRWPILSRGTGVKFRHAWKSGGLIAIEQQ